MASSGVLSTTGELMPLGVFRGLVWAFFAICVMLYIGRVWIRWASMRKLVREDYLMFFALCLQLATAIIIQLRLGLVYMMEDVGNGLRAAPATFMDDVPKALRGMLASQILTAFALWGVKFNFLLFFYRIFCSASRLYRIIWWTVVGFTIASFGVFLGVMSYTCTAGDVTVILTECTQPHMIRLEWIEVQTSSAIDAANDLLIMVFPIAILWKVRISLKRKLWLSFMFALSLFTVAMAIIRGTISYGRIASDYSQSQNISWVWFWLQMELVVSFMVACMCSFQALFTNQKKKKTIAAAAGPRLDGNQPRTIGSSGKKSSRRGWQFYDTLVETCCELEGVSNRQAAEMEADQTIHVEVHTKHDSDADMECITETGGSSGEGSWDRLPLDSYCMDEQRAETSQILSTDRHVSNYLRESGRAV